MDDLFQSKFVVYPFNVKYVRQSEIDKLKDMINELKLTDGECVNGDYINEELNTYIRKHKCQRLINYGLKETLSDDEVAKSAFLNFILSACKYGNLEEIKRILQEEQPDEMKEIKSIYVSNDDPFDKFLETTFIIEKPIKPKRNRDNATEQIIGIKMSQFNSLWRRYQQINHCKGESRVTNTNIWTIDNGRNFMCKDEKSGKRERYILGLMLKN